MSISLFSIQCASDLNLLCAADCINECCASFRIRRKSSQHGLTQGNPFRIDMEMIMNNLSLFCEFSCQFCIQGYCFSVFFERSNSIQAVIIAHSFPIQGIGAPLKLHYLFYADNRQG